MGIQNRYYAESICKNVVQVLKRDRNIIGLAVAGSWLTSQIDKWSDLDLVIVTKEDLNADSSRMVEYASLFGNLLSALPGEHVGEKRLLICLYDAPLLHVNIKFVTLEEFCIRIEDPIILLDTDNILQKVICTISGF
ncbi:nucleotidyltransferase domain-containing protein [Sphingobacterium puteale]|uniref:nucleotidyltransferase domain-containing protein n=1 Tax=Sphingobacterium puteale TaxID=2420510 RepID=UPI001C7DF7F6